MLGTSSRAVVVAALLVAQAGCGSLAAGDPSAAGPSAAGSPSAATSPSAVPSSAAAPSSAPARPDPKVARILAGKRKVLVHVLPADRDLSATYEGPITVGDGTDDGALFRVRPASKGRHLLEALRAREEGGRWCVAVQTENDLATLTVVECEEAAETLFTIEATGQTDDKKRPTHRIVNARYGTVQWDAAGRVLRLDTSGGRPATFSFVDRGTV